MGSSLLELFLPTHKYIIFRHEGCPTLSVDHKCEPIDWRSQSPKLSLSIFPSGGQREEGGGT